MSDKGPQSYAESVRRAQQSQQNKTVADTRSWNSAARDNYYKNGGR